MQYIIYLLFFLFFVYLIRNDKRFVLLLPLFHLMVDISYNYFESLSLVTFLRAIFVMALLYYFRKEIFQSKINIPLYVFFIYTLLLVLFSSELLYSIKGYTQVFLSMIMYIVGYIYIYNEQRLKHLNVIMTYLILLTLFSIILGYLFGVGRTLEYTAEEEQEKIGLLGSGALYSGALSIALLPIILTAVKGKYYRMIIYISSLLLYLFIILNVRRTAILIPIIGLLVYFIFSPQKTKLIYSMIVGLAIIFIIGSFYEDILVRRFEVRQKQGRFEKDFYLKEARYLENIYLMTSTIKFNDLLNSFFGIGNNIYAEHVLNNRIVRRMYHTDSAKLLYGSGIMGIVLYILIYLIFIKRLKKNNINNDDKSKKYRAMALSLIIVSIFVSFNGSLNQITFRSILFLYLGTLTANYKTISTTAKIKYRSILKKKNNIWVPSSY